MKKFVRGIYILWVVFRYGLDQIVLVNLQRPGIRLLARALSAGRRFDAPRGQRLREALERLGPIFVKFGQVLSTRRDLLPADIADELAKLQDQVPPFDPAIAVATIEASLQLPLDEVFADFTMEPVASASIAQVHFATLRDRSGGLREVAVKVLRPGMLPVIEQDLALMRILAGWVTRLSADGRRLRPLDVVDEFDRYLHDELDLVREAANAAQLRRNMEKAGCKVLIPGMFWDWCRADVLVMERMHGVPVGDMAQLRAAGINLPQLAADGLNIFFTQVFRDGFFHADMHPGNIRVSLAPQTFGWYILLDFGIVGMLTGFDKEYLARNFAAFFRRDYRGVAQLHIDSGWVPPETRVEELEAAVRTVCEPYFDRPLRDISLGMVLMRLFQMSRRFQVSIQPQLVMLQKTMLNVEGLGRQLDPDLDLWRTAKPFLEKWMSEQIGLRHLVQRLRTEASAYADIFPELPRLLHGYLQRREDHSRRKMLEQLLHTQRHTHQLLQALLYICLGFVGAMALALLYFRHLA